MAKTNKGKQTKVAAATKTSSSPVVKAGKVSKVSTKKATLPTVEQNGSGSTASDTEVNSNGTSSIPATEASVAAQFKEYVKYFLDMAKHISKVDFEKLAEEEQKAVVEKMGEWKELVVKMPSICVPPTAATSINSIDSSTPATPAKTKAAAVAKAPAKKAAKEVVAAKPSVDEEEPANGKEESSENSDYEEESDEVEEEDDDDEDYKEPKDKSSKKRKAAAPITGKKKNARKA